MYFKNYLVTRGDKELVDRMLNYCRSPESIFDFDKIDPIPSELKKICPPSLLPGGQIFPEQRMDEKNGPILLSAEDKAHLINKYGASNWMDWTQRHWGVNQCAYDIEISHSNDSLSFSTAQSPPFGIYQQLASLFPELRIEAAYSVYMGDNVPYCGWMVYVDGEQTMTNDSLEWPVNKVDRFIAELNDLQKKITDQTKFPVYDHEQSQEM